MKQEKQIMLVDINNSIDLYRYLLSDSSSPQFDW